MVEMSGHEQCTAMKAAAEACVLAGRTDLIARALDVASLDGAAAATTWLAERIASERAESVAVPAAANTRAPASRATPSPASGRGLFGAPTAAERDPLAAAIEKRLRAMYPATPPAAGKS